MPQLAVELGDRSGARWSPVEGSMLSADISGFTALSERLAGQGKAGAERITELVNACFTTLIEAASRWGGDVVKFGGDALLVLFRGEHHRRRAGAAAVTMQRALAADRSARAAALSMSVGVADGPFDAFVVGSGYRDLLVTGPRATEVVRLEGAAARGETLVSPAIAVALGHATAGTQRPSGSAPGMPIPASADVGPAPPVLPHPSPDPRLARPFVPRAVDDQLAAFSSLGGEHRLVTVAFVQVTGVREVVEASGPPSTTRELDALVDAVVASADRHDVTLLHSDIALDGFKLILCAGAPTTAGATQEAVLRTALEVARPPTPFQVRVGVHAGRVFAGFVGAPRRRTYTLMGDAVNTAARLLGRAAPGEVLATEAVTGRVEGVEAERLEPFPVKGKRELLVADRVHSVGVPGRHPAAASPSRLLGRDRELRQLAADIRHRRSTVIEAPAGAGKSVLVDAAIRRARTELAPLRVVRRACLPFEREAPYAPFRRLLRATAGLDPAADPATAGRSLSTLVRSLAPELRPLLPLLTVPLGATVEPTAESEAIAPRFRRARIHDAVVDFLDVVTRDPLVLVVEDTHWLDEASGDLLSHLIGAAATRRWSIIVTRRPAGGWAGEDVVGADHVRRMALDPLDEAARRRLILAAAPRALSDRELGAIADRSGGNPLFAVELARAAGDRDGELPDTVEELIASRIDRLNPVERRVVRVASVFGPRFRSTDLLALLDRADRSVVPALLARDDLFAERAGRVEFAHHLIRDSAYEGLPYRRRRELHRRIGLRLESSPGEDAGQAVLLSVHFAAAGDRKKAWRYALDAAREAEAAGAPADAADSYARALAYAPRSLPWQDRVRTQVALGEMYVTVGRYEDAFAAFGRARRGSQDRRDRLHHGIQQARCRNRQGRYPAALRMLTRVVAACGPGDEEVEARARDGRASIYHQTARHERAREETARAASLARAVGDDATLAHALQLLHNCASVLGDPAADDHGVAALALYRSSGDRLGEAEMLNNLGVSAYYAARWGDAEQLYRRSLGLKERAGDLVGAAVARMNLAELQLERGISEEVDDLLESAGRNFEAAGFALGITYVSVLLGRWHALEGRIEPALEHLHAGRAAFEELGAPGHAADAEVQIALMSLLGGDEATAARHVGSLREHVARHPEHFDAPERAACLVALLTAVLVRRRSGPATEHLWEAHRCATAAGAGELSAVIDVLLGRHVAEAEESLAQRGVRRSLLLEVAGHPLASAAADENERQVQVQPAVPSS